MIWLAAVPALFAALCGDRAALCLLASILITVGAEWLSVPFHPLLWACLDLLVAMAIVRPGMAKRDAVIVALFLPAWIAYLAPDPWRYWIPGGVVILQFLLTGPAINFRCLFERARAAKGQWRDFDLRVRA